MALNGVATLLSSLAALAYFLVLRHERRVGVEAHG